MVWVPVKNSCKAVFVRLQCAALDKRPWRCKRNSLITSIKMDSEWPALSLAVVATLALQNKQRRGVLLKIIYFLFEIRVWGGNSTTHFSMVTCLLLWLVWHYPGEIFKMVVYIFPQSHVFLSVLSGIVLWEFLNGWLWLFTWCKVVTLQRHGI